MNLEQVTDKHLQDLERLSRELIDVIRRAKVEDESLMDKLLNLEKEAGTLRRARFDADNSEYMGF